LEAEKPGNDSRRTSRSWLVVFIPQKPCTSATPTWSPSQANATVDFIQAGGLACLGDSQAGSLSKEPFAIFSKNQFSKEADIWKIPAHLRVQVMWMPMERRFRSE
jgi:hypothetical protein